MTALAHDLAVCAAAFAAGGTAGLLIMHVWGVG